MLIHFCNSLIHVYGCQDNLRVSLSEYHKDLVSKALSHPFQTVKVENDLLKGFQTVADPLCLRAGNGRSVENVFQGDASLGKFFRKLI